MFTHLHPNFFVFSVTSCDIFVTYRHFDYIFQLVIIFLPTRNVGVSNSDTVLEGALLKKVKIMFEENIKYAANQTGETAQKISGDSIQAGSNNEVNTTEYQAGSALQTMLNRAQQFKTGQAQNDNTPNGDDNGGGDNTPSPSPTGMIVEDSVEDSEGNSYQVYIDVDEVSKRTHISKTELVELCSGTNTAVAIPTDLVSLNGFITVNQGAASTAGKLSKRKILPPETRAYFLKRAQEYGYLWLKGEVQLGNEIRAIERRFGKRTDLEAANDNKNPKRKTAKLNDVLKKLRTKKEVLAEDYDLGYSQAGELARLTDDLVEKELDYAQKHNETLSRNHALSFLNLPPDWTDEEKAAMDTTDTGMETETTTETGTKVKKPKFKFETVRSTIPFEQRKKRKLKHKMPYCHLFACAGSDGYYLEQHGFECVLANELKSDIADYFALMYPKAEVLDDDFRKRYNELVEKFKAMKIKLLLITNPCQDFCSQKPKNWRDDDRLTLIIDIVRFIKDTKPKHILLENAKAFFSFSLPLVENLTAHPIAEELQKILNGRTIGDYLRDELTAENLGYHMNFAIEDSSFYGCAQSRVRSIMLASTEGVWNWPCAEEFATSLWEVIGHLPSLEAGEDSGIPYHKAGSLHKDKAIAEQIKEALAHTATGRCPKDNDPRYQLPGFGFFGAKGARKFWDKPSNTIDTGNGAVLGLRTIHPGRLRKDGTYSDARPLTLLEVFLVNGLENYEIPDKFKNRENFVRNLMGEIFLPKLCERICLEVPVGDDEWEEMDENPE